MPFKFIDPKLSLIDLLNPYAIIRNNRGERGQPCLVPFSGLKKGEVVPLISITKETKLTQLITQEMKP
jgi:hypothetical protein